jgi:hypothetical protein
MLSAVMKQVEERSGALRAYLKLCEICDEAIAIGGGEIFAELNSRSAISSSLAEEKVLRHCNVITQSYGLYEWCIETVLSSWLNSLPRYQLFTDLPESFQKTYRMGIARIIGDIDKRRFRDHDLEDVVEKFAAAVQGKTPWDLINDAITFHQNNLRKDDIITLFNSAGVENVWGKVEAADAIEDFKADSGIGQSLERSILELVDFRNDAAHGRPDEILGIEGLRQRVDFVHAFCRSLSDVVTGHILREQVKHCPEMVIGEVSETFRDNVIVAVCERGSLEVGQEIYFLKDGDCRKIKLESLQIDDVNQDLVQIVAGGMEVGIKTSARVRKHAHLVAI